MPRAQCVDHCTPRREQSGGVWKQTHLQGRGALLKLDGRLERLKDLAHRRTDLRSNAVSRYERDFLDFRVAWRRHVADLCTCLQQRLCQALR